MKKILIPIIAVVSLTSISTFASSSTGSIEKDNNTRTSINQLKDKRQENPFMNDAIKAAITGNNYTGFVAAFEDQKSKIVVPTQEEFAKMVANQNTKKSTEKNNAIQNAIIANDYTAFATAFNSKKTEDKDTRTVPTQAEFIKMVEKNKKAEAVKAAIIANDYTAFVSAFNANKPTVPTQEEFTKLIETKEQIKEIREEKKEGTITTKQAQSQITELKEDNKKSAKKIKKSLKKITKKTAKVTTSTNS